MASVDLFELHYTKSDIAKVPAADRTCFLMATGLANDVLTLYKLFALAIADDKDELIIKQGNSSVAMLLLRNLAGRLWEGRTLLHESFSPIASTYEPLMSPEAIESLVALRKYFAKKKHLIARVRNNVAFHADIKTIQEAFDRLPYNADMGDYFSQTLGNTLYYSAEMLQYEAINGFTEAGEQMAALKELSIEVKEIAVHFNTFVFGFVRAFLQRHLPVQYEAMWKNRTVLTDIAEVADLRMPFFMVVPEGKAAGSA